MNKIAKFIKSIFNRERKTIKLSLVKSKYTKYKDQLTYLERRSEDLKELSEIYYDLLGIKGFLSLGLDTDVVRKNMKLLIHGENNNESLYLDFKTGKLYLGNVSPIKSIREFLKNTTDKIYKCNYLSITPGQQKDLKKLWKKYKNIFKV